MTTWLSYKTAFCLAALGSALTLPLACGDSGDVFSAGVGGASGDCVVDGQSCEQGCDDNLGCVECTDDSDCGTAQPVCIAGECEECGSNADCPTGQSCFPQDHQCQDSCETAADCEGDEPICDPDTGACVGCLTAADCDGDQPFCSNVTSQCVECEADADCGAARPICDLEEGRCRECLLDTHCPSAQPYCDDHHCVDHPECPTGLTACGADCVDTAADPDHCGSCNQGCDAEEYCDSGSCACRPGLTEVAGNCVDLDSDPENCGSPENACDDPTPQCEGGDCVDGCSGELQECNDACVDIDSSPLHCGECGNRCDGDTICIGGDCQSYAPTDDCNSCNGELDSCCGYPGDANVQICVEGGDCP